MTPQEIAAWVVSAAAGLAALGYLGKRVRDGVHLLDRIEGLVRSSNAVVERELEANHGSSIKDDISGIAYTVGNLWARLEQLERDLHAHIERKKT